MRNHFSSHVLLLLALQVVTKHSARQFMGVVRGYSSVGYGTLRDLIIYLRLSRWRCGSQFESSEATEIAFSLQFCSSQIGLLVHTSLRDPNTTQTKPPRVRRKPTRCGCVM